MLGRLTLEQKAFFCKNIARGYTLTDSMKRLFYEFPESTEQPYELSSFSKFTRSTEGIKFLEEATTQIREEAKTSFLSHSGSRIDILMELAKKSLEAIRDLKKDALGTRTHISLAQELRQTMKDIKEESLLVGAAGDTVFEDLSKFFAKVKRTKDANFTAPPEELTN